MLMDALLKREDLNVIFVDWERGATFPYFQATGDTRLVGINEIDFFIILKTLTWSEMSYFVIDFIKKRHFM